MRFQTLLIWRPFVHQPRTGAGSCARGLSPTFQTAQPAPGQAWQQGNGASGDGKGQVALGIVFVSLRHVSEQESCVWGVVVVSTDRGMCCPQALQKVLQVHLYTQGAGLLESWYHFTVGTAAPQHWPLGGLGSLLLLLPEPSCREELLIGLLPLFSDVGMPSQLRGLLVSPFKPLMSILPLLCDCCYRCPSDAPE